MGRVSKLGFGVIALAAVLVGATAGEPQARDAKAFPVRTGCPPTTMLGQRRNALVDDAIAAARRVVIDGKSGTYMGRTYRFTRRNIEVLQAIQLGGTPRLAGDPKYTPEARRRCGAAGKYAWAIIFHNTLTSVCCTRWVKFVVRIKDTWYVF